MGEETGGAALYWSGREWWDFTFGHSGGDDLCGRSLSFFRIVLCLNKRPLSFFITPLTLEFAYE